MLAQGARRPRHDEGKAWTAVYVEGPDFQQSPILLRRLSAAVNGAGAVSVAGGNPF